MDLLEKNISKIIKIDKRVPIVLNKKLIGDEFGSFEVSFQNEESSKINSFDLEKDTLLNAFTGREGISAREKLRRIRKENVIPLDAYCALEIWKNEELLILLQDKWYDYYKSIQHPVYTPSIDFPGTLFKPKSAHKDWVDHILSIEIEDPPAYSRNKFKLVPYEIGDEGWNEESPSLVFSKEFSRGALVI